MNRLTRLILVAFLALAAVVLFSPARAGADPGSNYTQQFSTVWITAGDHNSGGHDLNLQFQPATDYWKFEFRLQCPDPDELYADDAWETVTWSVSKVWGPGGGPFWATGTSSRNGSQGTSVQDFDYPGGSGVGGYHTPNWNGWWVVKAATYNGDYGTYRDIAPCQYKFVVEKHT